MVEDKQTFEAETEDTNVEGIDARAFTNGSDIHLQPTKLSDVATMAQEAAHAVRSELEGISEKDMSAEEQAFSGLVNSPATYGMFRQLDRHGVDTLNLPDLDSADPRRTLSDILVAGDEALKSEGIPSPDMNIYRRAAEEAAASSRSLEDVVAEAEAVQPLETRNDLAVETPQFSMGTSLNIIAAQDYEAALGVSGQAKPEAASLGKDFEPSNYQEYDVHLMAYPLGQKDLPFDLGTIISRDSHAYVVITEPGGDPLNPEEALLVTRAGPDDNGMLLGSSGTDSSLGNEQNPTEDDKGSDGDVYVATFEGSRADITVPNAFTLERTRITGDLTEIRNEISDFRDYINGEDINYELVNRNSNTYAGDVYEKLTGDEPDNPHSGLFGRRTPALDNDLLVNYEETEYANDFN